MYLQNHAQEVEGFQECNEDGNEIVVELDESKISRRKYHHVYMRGGRTFGRIESRQEHDLWLKFLTGKRNMTMHCMRFSVKAADFFTMETMTTPEARIDILAYIGLR